MYKYVKVELRMNVVSAQRHSAIAATLSGRGVSKIMIRIIGLAGKRFASTSDAIKNAEQHSDVAPGCIYQILMELIGGAVTYKFFFSSYNQDMPLFGMGDTPEKRTNNLGEDYWIVAQIRKLKVEDVAP